jgi:hypothetical protein
MEISAELQIALGALVGALLALATSIVSLLQKRVEADKARAAADQAIASAEQARLERELAQAAATEVRTLGAALGAGTVSGALAREGEG